MFTKMVSFSLSTAALLIFTAGTAIAAKPTTVDNSGVETAWSPTSCTTIQSGELLSPNGGYLTTGFDDLGYNYQAHLFNGKYCVANYFPGCYEMFGNADLTMKWNDAYLSNTDCDGDGHLDEHYGFDSFKGSGAWLTSHIRGINADGTHWENLLKAVAVPLDAVQIGNMWYTADGVEIGPVWWGDFAYIQLVANNLPAGAHGIFFNGEAPTGFGYYQP